MNANFCNKYATSEQYISFLVRYNNDLSSVENLLNPECTTVINTQFLIAYKNIQSMDNSPLLQYRNAIYPKCYALMDESAIAATGALRVQTLSGLSLTGKDVLVGFVDTGIDIFNPIFQTKQGTTRIEAIWDQTATGFEASDTRYGYGAVFNRTQINAAISSSAPLVPNMSQDNSHGTFLASVCAGSEDPSVPFSSMAPDATILAVKLKQAKQNLREFYGIDKDVECFSEDDIMLGIDFLLQKAKELGKPIAICLALGTNQGDHDQSTVLEQYLTTLSYLRGVCLVSAAGNELGYQNHFRKAIPPKSDFSAIPPSNTITPIEVNVEQENDVQTNFSMEIWGFSPDLPRLSVVSPSGERFSQIPYLRPGNASFSFLFEQTSLYVEAVPTNILTGSPMFFLRFDNAAEGIWTIEVTHKKTIDAWLPVHTFLQNPVSFVSPYPNITVTSPGNGNGTITVAGYNHTNNSIYQNSGRGYTRLLRIKPDLAAPAVNVFGAFSPSTQNRTLFTRYTGTSVAAAITTGAAALLLEWFIVRGNNTSVNTTILREYLIRGAKMPQNRTSPNREFGFGILDLIETFDQFRSNI